MPCGTGRFAESLASAGKRFVGADLSHAMLGEARRAVDAESASAAERACFGLVQADAARLPFADASFDVVLSTFGAMFAPDQRRTAREMMRVLRSGGRLGMANWTPEGFIGRLFRVIGRHVPPPAGLVSPALWGTEAHLAELFGPHAADLRAERRVFNFRYRSAAHWIQVFRDYYGPTHKAFAALDAGGQQALEHDLTALLGELNVAGPASLVVPGEYLEVVVTRR